MNKWKNMKYSWSFIVFMIQHLAEIQYKITITACFKLQFLNAYNPEPDLQLMNYYSFIPITCKTSQNEKKSNIS